mgnify:CR=1 FL=1
MNIFLFAIGAQDRASSRLRVWDHVAWLTSQGHDVHVDSLADQGQQLLDGRLLRRLMSRYARWVWNFFRADAVLIQESMVLWPVILFRNLGKRRRLVFDFSDPIDRAGSPRKRRTKRRLLKVFARHSDAIVIENRSYADLLRHDGKAIDHFYGPVDASRFRKRVEELAAIPRPNGAFRIGWTGSPGTLKFILPLLAVIDRIAGEDGLDIELALIGVGHFDHGLTHARVTVIPWTVACEFEVVPSFDLALFRLEDTEDALWRGGGKLFVYMSSGVPFIATDKGIATSLMDDSGLGYRVGVDSDWPSVLRRAISDVEGRRAAASASLLFAQENLSYEEYRRRILSVHLLNEPEE